MGLDCYFYIRTKAAESDCLSDSDINSLIADCDIRSNINRLNAIAKHKEISIKEVIIDALEHYYNSIDEGYSNEVMYFRKFHFLLKYFNYTDEWYAKYMEIPKDVAIELRDYAKSCIDEINSECVKNFNFEYWDWNECHTAILLDDEDYSFVDDIMTKYFDNPNTDINRVYYLYSKLAQIIDGTDWDHKSLIFTANW